MNLNWKRPLFYLLIPIWLFYVFCGFPPPLPPWRPTRAAQEQSEQWRDDSAAEPLTRTEPKPPP
jgi:hypothetical protein